MNVNLESYAGGKKGKGRGHGDRRGKPPVVKDGPTAIGVPLGKIIPRSFRRRPDLVLLQDPRSVAAERYRRLVSTLDNPSHGEPPKVILVTSATPNEGKTTTAVNLALAMSENQDHKTILVDSDLRRPTIDTYIKPRPKWGLSTILKGEFPLEHALQGLEGVRLSFLPAGEPMENPLGYLRSDLLADVFSQLRERYDRIVIDSPPSVPFADSTVLNGHADGAILVVRSGKTTKPMIYRALEALSNGEVLGAVLNGVEVTPVDRYYYKYDAYNPNRYSGRDWTEDSE